MITQYSNFLPTSLRNNTRNNTRDKSKTEIELNILVHVLLTSSKTLDCTKLKYGKLNILRYFSAYIALKKKCKNSLVHIYNFAHWYLSEMYKRLPLTRALFVFKRRLIVL